MAEAVRMLVVDDDVTFRKRLVKAVSARGYLAHDAGSAAEAVEVARRVRPQRVVVDLRMPGRSGLALISELMELDPAVQIVVLTGYGSIATAVEAVRSGAVDYLQKPADTEQILAAFEREGEGHAHAAAGTAAGETPPSLARVEWEHIQRILADCGGNISEAARRLGIHRRSLQRKLSKMPPLE
jgi:two-component system, response regulator RegA